MSLRPLSVRRCALPALVAALVVLFVWRGLVPAWRTLSTDFPNYYLAARLYLHGFPLERVYDWTWFQRQKDHAGITEQALVGYIPLSVVSALAVVPFASLPPLEAKRAWLVVNLLVLAALVHLLRRVTSMSWLRVLLVVFLAVVPLRTGFLFGQQHLLLAYLLAVAAWLDATDRPFASGSALAVASSLKLYPALFALYLVRKRRWRTLAGAAVTGLVLGLACLWLFGLEPLRVYVQEILPRGLRAENNDPYTVGHDSPNTLFLRLFMFEPELNPHPLAHAPVAYATLAALAQGAILVPGLWLLTPGRAEARRERLEWGAFVALLLVLSSASATYHFAVLIVATALIAGTLFEEGETGLAWALVVLHAAVCAPFYRFVPEAPGGWAIFAGFPRLYALLAYWGVVLVALARVRPDAELRRSAPRFAALFAAFVLFTLVGSLRHLAGVEASYATRLPRAHPTLLATAPSVAGDDVYFARMDDEGSTLDRTGAGLAVQGLRARELFHPTVTAASPDGWAELSSTTSSVVRFPRAASSLSVADLPVEVENGESPVVSPDGRWLAFLREDARGRDALHLLDLAAPAGSRTEQPVASAPPDVLDVGFAPDDRIVVAAMTASGPRLYEGGVAGPFALIDTRRPARGPAVSPDGRWLVYSGDERGTWRLWLRDRATGAERQLTVGDCNATDPAWLAPGTGLVYATDCGRGLRHTALATLDVPR